MRITIQSLAASVDGQALHFTAIVRCLKEEVKMFDHVKPYVDIDIIGAIEKGRLSFISVSRDILDKVLRTCLIKNDFIDRVAVVAEHVQLPLRRHVDEE